MLRLAIKVALAAAAICAIWTFVPVRDRTLAQRWDAAGGLSPFLERGWAEATGSVRRPPARPPQARQKPPERPTEGHTESDRRAIERILTEHLDDGKR